MVIMMGCQLHAPVASHNGLVGVWIVGFGISSRHLRCHCLWIALVLNLLNSDILDFGPVVLPPWFFLPPRWADKDVG